VRVPGVATSKFVTTIVTGRPWSCFLHPMKKINDTPKKSSINLSCNFMIVDFIGYGARAQKIFVTCVPTTYKINNIKYEMYNVN